MFRSPLLFVTDPQVIKQIAVKDFDHFVDHKPFVSLTENDMFGLSLPMLTGDKWRQMRATLSPAFTGSKMRTMFGLVSQTAAAMTETLAARPADRLQSLEMKELFSKYSLDVIATTAFGIGINSFEDEQNEFLVNANKMLSSQADWRAALKMMVMAMCPWLVRATGMQLMDGDIVKFFETMVVETMETRKRENITRPDVVDMLMQLRKGGRIAEDTRADAATTDGLATATDGEMTSASLDTSRTLTDRQIVAQCFLFFAAGFDTVSTTLSTMAYELATNPDVQRRVHAECAETRSRLAAGNDLPYDELQRMQYLDQVVTELLRLWPPALFSERMCVKPYAYDDGDLQFQMPAGQSVWIPIWSVQRDERYWGADAGRFDPNRFGADRKGDLVPGAYLPFGLGPRNCIASRFALMEMKAAVYKMVLKFEFVPCERTQIPLKLAKNPGGFKTERGIHLTLKVREAET